MIPLFLGINQQVLPVHGNYSAHGLPMICQSYQQCPMSIRAEKSWFRCCRSQNGQYLWKSLAIIFNGFSRWASPLSNRCSSCHADGILHHRVPWFLPLPLSRMLGRFWRPTHNLLIASSSPSGYISHCERCFARAVSNTLGPTTASAVLLLLCTVTTLPIMVAILTVNLFQEL